MNKQIRFVAVLFAIVITLELVTVGLLTWSGWHATERSAFTVPDAVSLCVRGAATGVYPASGLSTCFSLALRTVHRRQLVARMLWETEELERSFKELDGIREELRQFELPQSKVTTRY